MSFPRYPKYKHSGVEWLGEVPEHWDLIPLKHLADFVNGDAFKPADWAETGIPIIRIQNLNGGDDFNYFDGSVEDRYLVREGALLFGWSGNRGTSFGPFIWRKAGVHALNQHIFRVVPFSMDIGDLYWILKAVTAHVEDQAHGIIGMVHVTKGDLGSIKVPVPTPREQTAIATFLDRETAKIDALVAEQEKLIGLLQEKRQSVISDAVTKGLDPNVPMKDSGVEWLGVVPARWEVRSLRHLARLTTGMTPPTDEQENYDEVGYPWVRPEDLDESGAISKATKFLSAKGKALARHIAPGASLICCIGTIGKVGIVDESVSTNQQITSAKFHGCDRYFYFSTYAARTELENSATGNVLKILNTERLGEIKYPSPPLDEQAAIASFLDGELAKLDTLTAEARTAIKLLQERRTALISAAVTGQIDVRDFAPMEVALP